MFQSRKNFTKQKTEAIIVLKKDSQMQNPQARFFLSRYNSVQKSPTIKTRKMK